MVIELKVVADIVSDPNPKTGKVKTLKKGVIFKQSFNTEITTCSHYLDSKGNILKGYCNVISGGQYYKVKHTYEDVYNMLKPVKVKGFIAHAKGNYKS